MLRMPPGASAVDTTADCPAIVSPTAAPSPVEAHSASFFAAALSAFVKPARTAASHFATAVAYFAASPESAHLASASGRQRA